MRLRGGYFEEYSRSALRLGRFALPVFLMSDWGGVEGPKRLYS